MSAYFVTGTGTDIGKTYVTAGIIRAARQAGHKASAIKPILSGFSTANLAASDPGILLGAMGKIATIQAISAIAPWRYAAPLSPDMAASREGRAISLPQVMTFCSAARESAPGLMLIEGVGGAMVPLNEFHTVRDWIAGLKMPALLIAGTYLGAISHTLTTAEALTTRNIQIAAIILSESEASPVPAPETAAAIGRFLPHTPVHIIRRYYNARSFEQLAATLAG